MNSNKQLASRMAELEIEVAHLDNLVAAYREHIRLHFHDADNGVTMFRTDLGDMRVEGHPLDTGRHI